MPAHGARAQEKWPRTPSGIQSATRRRPSRRTSVLIRDRRHRVQRTPSDEPTDRPPRGAIFPLTANGKAESREPMDWSRSLPPRIWRRPGCPDHRTRATDLIAIAGLAWAEPDPALDDVISTIFAHPTVRDALHEPACSAGVPRRRLQSLRPIRSSDTYSSVR